MNIVMVFAVFVVTKENRFKEKGRKHDLLNMKLKLRRVFKNVCSYLVIISLSVLNITTCTYV